ncbi:hypothetical protein BDQ12DRAFT_654112 [Crucibulum laeve]|uniref:Homeodomain-like protein n=1 Tax=Crucibulum laeve TaxID=68775 RepID=A0A5C3LVA1_9AGAR|nr:hypothetical protein BDQ12DRAFT_654112 [Crucibulum laeve]
MHCRERRSWTAKEDELLRAAVQREDPENPNPSKWHAIAKHVPNRTNKDCRKRWFAKMASDVVKGGWAPDEDEKLVKGIERYGTRWSLVASVVQTRNSDQCAKRWTDTLNPAIDRTTWSAEADDLLLQAVNEHGKVWTKIVKTYFPGRTGLSAKNRYNSITRFNADSGRAARPRRKSTDGSPYSVDGRKTESVSSSSSSSSASPSTPNMPLPPPFPSSLNAAQLAYSFDALSEWSSSSSMTMEDMQCFSPSSTAFDGLTDGHVSLPSTPSGDASDSYRSFDITMNQTLSPFQDHSQMTYPSHSSISTTSMDYKQLILDPPTAYSSSPSQDLYSPFSQYPGVYSNNEMANHFALLDTMPSQVDPLLGAWEHSHQPETKAYDGFKIQPTNEFTYMF